MKKSVRISTFFLALLLFLLPTAAQAEAAGTPAPNMFTLRVNNIVLTENGQTTEQPYAVELTAGFDLKNMRGAALVSLIADNLDFSLMGSIESDEIRAQISDMETGILMPLTETEDMLIQDLLLMGLTYDQIAEDTREALTDLLDLMESEYSELIAAAVAPETQPTLLDAMYPADLWKTDYESWPDRMKAVLEGEEEINLFGETYTARKYTYSLENATYEEYEACYLAEDPYNVVDETSAAFEEAYDKLTELVERDYEAIYGALPLQAFMDSMTDDDLWTDDGTVTEGEGGSLSEWEEAAAPETLYSISGTLWMVDEVMGIVEEYELITTSPDGDQVERCTYSDMLTGNVMRYEEKLTYEFEGYFSSTSISSASIVQQDNGDAVYDQYSLLETLYDGESEPYRAETTSKTVITGNRMIHDTVVTGTGYFYEPGFMSDGVMNIHMELTEETDDETGMLNDISGMISVLADGTAVSMDIGLTTGFLPAGELLPRPEQAINPLTADEETMAAFSEEMATHFMQLIGSLMPAPETSSSVGGALFS